jgi:ADP-heptose:LPS heptosyltransferase
MTKKTYNEPLKLNPRFSGGLGKQIMATCVLKAIRDKFPDAIIHAMTSYPEAFHNLEFVDRTYPMNAVPHFFEDHRDFEVMECEPYTDLDFRNGELHLIEAWCKKFDLQAPANIAGIIKLTEEERRAAQQIIMQQKMDRPMVAFQPFGGTSYYNQNEANNPIRPKQYRDLDKNLAQEIVNKLVELGYAVVHIGLPTEPQLQNTLRLSDKDPINPRYIFAILERCHYGIFIDSFAQHAWAALGKNNALVLWGGTNPENLGYKTNKNLSIENGCTFLHCGRPNTHMFDFGGNGQPWRCVYGGKCMKFKADFVIEEFLKANDEEKLKQFHKKLEKEKEAPKVLKPKKTKKSKSK